MTIPESEALRMLRATFKSAPSAVRKALRSHPHAPLCASAVPGWEYYQVTDSVVYTGDVVGGN